MQTEKGKRVVEEDLGWTMWAAGFVVLISGCMISLAVGGLYQNVNHRLVLTAPETFSGLADIRDIFRNTTSYILPYNPATVDHVPFAVETREEVEELQARGLVNQSYLDAYTVADASQDPSLLHRVMVASWCSSGVPIPGTIPARRTPGCSCIADSYLALVTETLPAGASNLTAIGSELRGGYNATYVLNGTTLIVLRNGTNTTFQFNGLTRTVQMGGVSMTALTNPAAGTVWLNWTNATLYSPTVVNVSLDVRERVASRVYRCWDLRLVRRSRSCGRVCNTHVTGLALFADVVLFLVGLAFVLFSRFSRSWGPYMVKLAVIGAAVALSVPFFARYADANLFNLIGIGACVFLLLVSLHYELCARPLENVNTANPFMVALLVNLPLIVSAHTIQICVSGYGRDVWASLSFGVCGGLLGLLLQLYFWTCWNEIPDRDDREELVELSYWCRQAYTVAYASLQILLTLLFVAYRFPESPYASGGVAVFVLYQLFLTALPVLLQQDFHVLLANGQEKSEYPPKLSFLQLVFVVLVVIGCAGMTITGFIDSSSL